MPSTWFGNFKRGVFTATPWTMLLALGLGALALAGLQWFVTSGAFTVFPDPHIIRNINDDSGSHFLPGRSARRRSPRDTRRSTFWAARTCG